MLDDEQNLFLVSDDRGKSFYQVDQSGTIQKMIRFPNSSGMSLLLFIDDNGNYNFFDEEGYVINIKHDGYFRPEDLLRH